MTACSCTLVAHLLDEATWTDLPVTLDYRAAAPCEVTVAIGVQQIEWKLSRELLRAGTTQRVGEGDIRLWPGGEPPGEQLFVHLSSDSGQALLELPRGAVLEFLGVTELVVPTGTESAESRRVGQRRSGRSPVLARPVIR